MCSCHNRIFQLFHSLLKHGHTKNTDKHPTPLQNCANLSPQNAALLLISNSLDDPISQKLLPTIWQRWPTPGAAMASKGQNDLNHSLSALDTVDFQNGSHPTLFQFSDTSSLAGIQCTGARSIDWHSLQSLTTACIAALETFGLTNFTKYSVCFMPGCLQDQWMACIWTISSSSATAHSFFWFCHGTDFSIVAAPYYVDQPNCHETWLSPHQYASHILQPVLSMWQVNV